MSTSRTPLLAFATSRDRTDVTAPLREYLRRALGQPALDYEVPPSPILGGFDTFIHSFQLAEGSQPYDAPLILRVFRTSGDAERAAYEATVQNAVASLDYPAPRVLIIEREQEALGAPFTIMQRLPGHVMLDALLGPQMFAMPAVLARAHVRLHGLDVAEFRRMLAGARDPRGLDSLDALLERYAQSIETSRLDGMRAALRWLRERRPGVDRESVCHGDFHPLNVLIEGKEVTGVVDWGWAAVADPAYDVGSTVALMTQGPIDIPRFVHPLARVIRRSLVRRYLRAYASERSLDMERVRYYEAMRLTGFLLEVGEQLRDEAAVIAEHPGSAFMAPHVRAGVRKRLMAITGIDAQLPES